MLINENVSCPYCGEVFEASIDVSAGSQEYIEDCYVCCRPIVFHISVDLDGTLMDIATRRDDE